MNKLRGREEEAERSACLNEGVLMLYLLATSVTRGSRILALDALLTRTVCAGRWLTAGLWGAERRGYNRKHVKSSDRLQDKKTATLEQFSHCWISSPRLSLAAALWKQFLLFLLWFDSSFTASTLCLDLAHNKRTSFLSHPEVITINFISISFVILLSFAGWWWVVILVHGFLSWVYTAQRNAGAE